MQLSSRSPREELGFKLEGREFRVTVACSIAHS